MNSALLDFIRANPEDWEARLSEPPYCIAVKRDGRFALLKYAQFSSDPANAIVREARGIIVGATALEIVCRPFDRFFNVQDPNSAHHNLSWDWASARVQEKIDGSLIKVWYDLSENRWRVSTNGTIDAYRANVDESGHTFGELFDLAADKLKFRLFASLDRAYTYLFELVSPYIRNVVDYPSTEIYHIGTRRTCDGVEVNADVGVRKPETYTFASLADVMYQAEQLGRDKEGFVVVDKHFNRVKVKGAAYVKAHTAINNGAVSDESLLEMVVKETVDDFLALAPIYASRAKDISAKYTEFCETVRTCLLSLQAREGRKMPAAMFAEEVRNSRLASLLFAWHKGTFEIENLQVYLRAGIRFATLSRYVLDANF